MSQLPYAGRHGVRQAAAGRGQCAPIIGEGRHDLHRLPPGCRAHAASRQLSCAHGPSRTAADISTEYAHDFSHPEIKYAPRPEQLSLIAHRRDAEARYFSFQRGRYAFVPLCDSGVEPRAQRTRCGNAIRHTAATPLRKASVLGIADRLLMAFGTELHAPVAHASVD